MLPSLVLLSTVAACRNTQNPSTPTPPPGQGPTITIAAAGVSPKNIDVTIGMRVLFVNSDSVSHHVGSDPHPDHTDCPDINQVGFLLPGQSRETGNLVQPRVCGFHDHDRPTVQALRGTITIR